MSGSFLIIFSSVALYRGQPAAKCHLRWQPTNDWQSAVGWGDAGFEPGTAGQQSGALSHHASHHWATMPPCATMPPNEPPCLPNWATMPPNEPPCLLWANNILAHQNSCETFYRSKTFQFGFFSSTLLSETFLTNKQIKKYTSWPPAGVRSTSGVYSCRVRNGVGASPLVDIVQLTVEDVPNVALTLFPLTPVRSEHH